MNYRYIYHFIRELEKSLLLLLLKLRIFNQFFQFGQGFQLYYPYICNKELDWN
jgi:hypothetical protein